jgi:hypothetical protein
MTSETTITMMSATVDVMPWCFTPGARINHEVRATRDAFCRLTEAVQVKSSDMTGMVRILTERHALVGKKCVRCKALFRAGDRVVIKPTAPARHERCTAVG